MGDTVHVGNGAAAAAAAASSLWEPTRRVEAAAAPTRALLCDVNCIDAAAPPPASGPAASAAAVSTACRMLLMGRVAVRAMHTRVDANFKLCCDVYEVSRCEAAANPMQLSGCAAGAPNCMRRLATSLTLRRGRKVCPGREQRLQAVAVTLYLHI